VPPDCTKLAVIRIL